MKFLRKNKPVKKENTKAEKKSSPFDFSETPVLKSLMKNDDTDGSYNDIEIAKRKAEFLELLAKEERAHRVKLAEMRNEPIKDHRSIDRDKPLAAPPKASTEESAASLAAKTAEPKLRDKSVSTHTEAAASAAIGKEIGGEAFNLTSEKPANTETLEVTVPPYLESKDVTSSFEKSQELKHSELPPVSIDSLRAQTDTSNKRSSKSVKKAVTDSHRDRVSQDSIDQFKDMDFSRPIHTGRADVNELRLDVSRIYTDIENGDALYRRAQQRVQGLMGFVEKAEVDFSMLERIEPENRRLKARNAMISKELEETVRKTSLIETELEDNRRRLAEVNAQYDTVNGNLAKAMKALAERDREIRQLNNDISATTLKLDREKTATDVEVRENKVLRDRVVNLTNELEDAKASRADTGKIVESLKIDLEDNRTARDRLETETYDLRHALDDAMKQNTQMKGEMITLHQDISTFKTQYEFNLISRDDRITLLESQIEDLARQLQIKEDIVSSAARDVTELRKSRTGGELERERLEKIIDTQTLQLEQAQKQITESHAAMQDMDTRYRDVAAALSITQNRRANQKSVKTPDIQPKASPVSEPAAAPQATPMAVDDYGSTGIDPIEDHVMAYKLGLRKNIIPKHLEDMPKVVAEDDIGPDYEEASPRPEGFETLDQDMIAERIMDYKLGLRKNIF